MDEYLATLTVSRMLTPHSAIVSPQSSLDKYILRCLPASSIDPEVLKSVVADVEFIIREKCHWMVQCFIGKLVDNDTRMDLSTDSRNYYILTECYASDSLQALVVTRDRVKRPFAEDEIIQTLLQLIMPVEFLMKIGWRDTGFFKHVLHPNRLRVSNNGLISLDICHAIVSSKIDLERFRDEQSYMPPEAISADNTKYDERSFIWTIGFILFNMMCSGYSYGEIDFKDVSQKPDYDDEADDEGNKKSDQERIEGMDLYLYVTKRLNAELSRYYSRPLRDLIKEMLSAYYGERPTILNIYARPFIFSHIVDVYKMRGEFSVEGGTPLMVAARIGDMHYINQCTSQFHIQDTKGRTALMFAAANGCVQACDYLIPHEITQRDYRKWTALMYAAANGHVNCAKLLYMHENGLCNVDNDTALIIAAERNHVEIVDFLAPFESGRERQNGESALVVAAWHCYPRCVALLMHTEAPRYAERALKAVTDPLCIGSEAKKQVIIAMLTDYLGAKVLPLKYISEPREEFLTENIGLLAQTNSLHVL